MSKKITEKQTEYHGPRRLKCPNCETVTTISAKLCPKCDYVFGPKDRALHGYGEVPRNSRVTSKYNRFQRNDEDSFIKAMVELGFKYIRHVDSLTGEIVKSEDDPKIEALGLRFSQIPLIAENVHITQTKPQIQIAMSLEKFFELVGIKPDVSPDAEA
jgi:uncharacterized OB-fold protein